MAEVTLKVAGYRCDRCGHEWIARDGARVSEKPAMCPKCKSVRWNAGARLPTIAAKKSSKR